MKIAEEQIEDAAIAFAENTIAVGDKDFILEHGFNNGAKWMQEQLEPKWIPVTERLPEVGVFVLVRRVEGYLSVDQYRQLHREVRSFIYNVTHWMHLPEPPKTV